MSADLMCVLGEYGLLEYGSVIPAELVRKVLHIKPIEVGTRAQFEEQALQELGAIDFVRNALIDQGKYITACRGGYRILLPSENQKQVEAYMKSADRKLRRAQRLSASTPRQIDAHDHTASRLHLKQFSHRRRGAPPAQLSA